MIITKPIIPVVIVFITCALVVGKRRVTSQGSIDEKSIFVIFTKGTQYNKRKVNQWEVEGYFELNPISILNFEKAPTALTAGAY
jgi:hypothetical protein